MTNALLWLFGCAALAATCNFPSWTILIKRWFENRKDIERLTIRTGMMFGSIGVLGISWGRASALYLFPDKPLPLIYFATPFGDYPGPAWSPFVWMTSLCIAETFYLLTSAIAQLKAGYFSVAPIIFAGMVTVWTGFILLRP